MTNEKKISELCGIMGSALHDQGATQKDIDLLVEYIEELPYHLQVGYSQAANMVSSNSSRGKYSPFNVLDGGLSDD